MAAGDGLVSMTPTSIAHSGTSASINADGGVDFTAVTSLSLNGVFTSDYDNYLVVIGHVQSSGGTGQSLDMRLRLSGSDASGSDYTYQQLIANGTSVSGARVTTTVGRVGGNTDEGDDGNSIAVYGPALAQPTAYRSVAVNARFGARTLDYAGTHSLSTAYDGVTLIVGNSMTGTVHVFGYEE